MSAVRSVKDLLLDSKRVLMRVDFNVPFNKSGQITDDTRIKAALPTIRYILDQGCSLVLISHLGRPQSKSPDLSLNPVSTRLSELLGKPVQFINDCEGVDVEKKVSQLQKGDVLLLENLRFCTAEENPESDLTFAQKLAGYGEVYIDDAFGSAHRAHSSISEVPKYFKGARGVGFLMEKELQFLGKSLRSPKRPFVAILGGSKISTKLGILKSLSEKADRVLVGGAMAFTLLKAKGKKIGASLVEEGVEVFKSEKFVLPLDFVCEKEGELKIFDVESGIDEGWKGFDIGPKTIEIFINEIKLAKTIFWNGPLGMFEDERFSKGTTQILKAVANSESLSIVGGGDSLAAVHKSGLAEKFSHLSTGGGASLEFIEFGSLPGIEALKE